MISVLIRPAGRTGQTGFAAWTLQLVWKFRYLQLKRTLHHLCRLASLKTRKAQLKAKIWSYLQMLPEAGLPPSAWCV